MWSFKLKEAVCKENTIHYYLKKVIEYWNSDFVAAILEKLKKVFTSDHLYLNEF